MDKHFCTCADHACPNHPQNHENGCDPCIRKNLALGEIPGCFFRKISDDLSEQTEFTFQSFTEFFLKNKDGYEDRKKNA